MTEDVKIFSKYELFGEGAKAITAEGSAPDPTVPDSLPRVWINAAKEGQVIEVNGELCSMTREGLESSVGTWKNGILQDNHKTLRNGFKIYEDRFESPFLAFLLDEKTAKSLEDAEGGSIDGIALKVKDKKILKLRGVGYSILEKGITPACTREAGCGIAAEGTADNKDNVVNIQGIDPKTNITIEADKVELKVNQNKGGNDIMVEKTDEKEEVTFSEGQVATIKAEAVKELTENMTALHKVEMTDLDKSHAAELKTLGETHATDLETQRAEVQKHVEMVDSISTKFALSPEARKTLIDAKTAEDVYTLLETLKVDKAEPVIAAEGGATGSGIILGTEVEAKAPETIKIEEVGTYDPNTRKYIPSYREELK